MLVLNLIHWRYIEFVVERPFRRISSKQMTASALQGGPSGSGFRFCIRYIGEAMQKSFSNGDLHVFQKKGDKQFQTSCNKRQTMFIELWNGETIEVPAQPNGGAYFNTHILENN